MLNSTWSIRRLTPSPSLSPFFSLPTTNTPKLRPNQTPFRFMASTTQLQQQQQQSTSEFLTQRPYHPPTWASKLNPIPSHAFSLGHVIRTLFPPSLPVLCRFLLLVLFDFSFRLQFTNGTFLTCPRTLKSG